MRDAHGPSPSEGEGNDFFFLPFRSKVDVEMRVGVIFTRTFGLI